MLGKVNTGGFGVFPGDKLFGKDFGKEPTIKHESILRMDGNPRPLLNGGYLGDGKYIFVDTKYRDEGRFIITYQKVDLYKGLVGKINSVNYGTLHNAIAILGDTLYTCYRKDNKIYIGGTDINTNAQVKELELETPIKRGKISEFHGVYANNKFHIMYTALVETPSVNFIEYYIGSYKFDGSLIGYKSKQETKIKLFTGVGEKVYGWIQDIGNVIFDEDFNVVGVHQLESSVDINYTAKSCNEPDAGLVKTERKAIIPGTDDFVEFTKTKGLFFKSVWSVKEDWLYDISSIIVLDDYRIRIIRYDFNQLYKELKDAYMTTIDFQNYIMPEFDIRPWWVR